LTGKGTPTNDEFDTLTLKEADQSTATKLIHYGGGL